MIAAGVFTGCGETVDVDSAKFFCYRHISSLQLARLIGKLSSSEL